jgi:DNA-binding LytR/AlgR family response regulator
MKNVLIIEDEEVNAHRLRRLLLKIRPHYTILAVLNGISKSVEWLSKHSGPDLILMDIHLADGLCFEIFDRIEIKCPIIFTTAYDEYALKAFRYNSIDYLLKPVEETDLAKGLDKFESSSINEFYKGDLIKNLVSYMGQREYRERFLLPYKDGYRMIDVKDVAFFYSQEGVCIANLFNGQSNIISHTLDSLEQQLNPKDFFRANRQYIVHINAIRKVHNYFGSKLKVDLKDYQDNVIVSRLKAVSFKDWLDS